VATLNDPRGSQEALFDVEPQSLPWHELLVVAENDTPTDTSPLAWLERLDARLPVYAAACRDEASRLATQWRHMAPHLESFRPEEIESVVAQRISAATRCGAADALIEMVRAEQSRLRARTGSSALSLARRDALRALLDGVFLDRMETSRSLTGIVLETLCSIALDLEVTERHVGGDASQLKESLAELRAHITQAAAVLRRLPDNVDVKTDIDEPVARIASRCVARYADSLDVQLLWRGGEPQTAESAEALLWVLQELLCHLRLSTAGWATVTVALDSSITMTVTTPSAAFHVSGEEPLWLSRCRLRLHLAEGELWVATTADGSSVRITLPR
jgi:hypothetical protein